MDIEFHIGKSRTSLEDYIDFEFHIWNQITSLDV